MGVPLASEMGPNPSILSGSSVIEGQGDEPLLQARDQGQVGGLFARSAMMRAIEQLSQDDRA